MRIDIAASALNTFSTGMAVTANNIANANTDRFRSTDVHYETGPEGQGVRVGDLRQNTQPGPLRQDAASAEYTASRMARETRDAADTQNTRETQAMQERRDNAAALAQKGLVEGSNTDIAREMTDMMVTQRAFEANVASIRAHDNMLGVLIDDFV